MTRPLRDGIPRTLRVFALSWRFHFKMMSQSAFDGFLAVLWPLFFATTTFFMFRAGHHTASLASVGLGSAVMAASGVSSTAFGGAVMNDAKQMVSAPAVALASPIQYGGN